MAKVISKDNVNGFLVFIDNFITKILKKYIDEHRKEAFNEGREIGLENTFAALYAANVNDEEIIRVVCEFWNIPRQEAEDRLLDEKEQAVARNLERYMKRQGYRKREINDFSQMNQVLIRIKRNKDLWKLKDNPERLFKIIQGHK